MKATLHAISTGEQSTNQLISIAKMIHPYVQAIHIREKQKTALEICYIVEELLYNNVPLSKIIINDRVDVAYGKKVKGIHLAHHSLPIDIVKKEFPGLTIGYSCHSLHEAMRAQEQGADYLFYGHIFPTKSKPGVPPRGLNSLKLICDKTTLPVIAIGGINPQHVLPVLQSGADGIAVMSTIWKADNPLRAVKAYADKLKR